MMASLRMLYVSLNGAYPVQFPTECWGRSNLCLSLSLFTIQDHKTQYQQIGNVWHR